MLPQFVFTSNLKRPIKRTNLKKQRACHVFIVLIIVLPFSSFSQQTGKIKVIAYNIMNGFDWGKDTARQREMAEWFQSQHSDVVALEDMCGFTEEKLKLFAKSWGHNYSALLKEDGYPIALTSNKPITVVTKMMHDGYGHGMLHTITHGIHFFGVHMNPGDFTKRREESALIRAYMRHVLTESDSLYMVLGDFNAQSVADSFLTSQRTMLLERYQRFDSASKKDKNLVNNKFDYSVIASFTGYPLVDICELITKPEDRFSFPTPILIGTWKKANEIVPTRERIDFILTSPQLAIRCSSATIINSGIVDKLSDHFPVIAEFDAKQW